MDTDNGNAQKAVQFLVQKNITRLFKSLLGVVEDVKNENGVMVKKISDRVDDDFSNSINYLTPERADFIRKRVLDLGNESIREINGLLDVFELVPNEKKLEKLIESKKISRHVNLLGGGYFMDE
jgi:hypothetical protein